MKKSMIVVFAVASSLGLNAQPLSETFPLGVYHGWERNGAHAQYAGVSKEEYVDKLFGICKDMNCDTIWVVNCPKDRVQILKTAEKHGLGCLLNTALQKYIIGGQFSGKMEDIDALAKESVAEMSPYKSFLGYVLKDEPAAILADQLNHFADVFKRHDPKRDSLVVVSPRHFPNFLKASNLPVGCTDIYYFGGPYSDGDIPSTDSQLMYRRATRMAIESGRRFKKNVWIMPQAFGEGYGASVVDPVTWKRTMKKGSYLIWRMPTDAETRWQIWEALRAGAKGIIMFSLADPGSLTEDSIVNDKDHKYSYEQGMARAAKGNPEKLFKEDTEIDSARSLILKGFEPAHQFLAVKDAFGKIAPHKDRFLKADIAPFPVFFASVGETLKCQTFFEKGSKQRFGVLVNDDWKNEKSFTVRVPDNVDTVRDLNGSLFSLSIQTNDNLKTFQVKLAPGDGMIVEATFEGGEPGILFSHEDFGRTHWMGWVNTDACTLELNESFHFKGENVLKIKDSYTNELPVKAYWFGDIARPGGSTWNMTSMNVNAKEKRANMWITFDAECDEGVELWAHLGDSNDKTAKEERFWKTGDPLPVQVPVGTGIAFIKLASRKACVVSADIWATPLTKPEPKDPEVTTSAMAGKTMPLKDDFPLGVYHGWERNDANAKYAGLDYDTFVDKLMGVCKEMNCDTVWIVNGPRNGQREKFLKVCGKYGLKTLFNTGMENLQGYFHHEFDGDFGKLASAVNRFVAQTTDSPAFWGYTTKDEPDYRMATQIEDFAELTRRLDPAKRETLACSTPPAVVPYLEATRFPVVCTDPYLFGGPKSTGDVCGSPESSKRMYRERVNSSVKTARLSGKHVWIMPQAYSWVRGPEWLTRDGKRMIEKGAYWIYRMPTDAEIRWQTWEAVRGGAKGIMYYVLSDSWTMDEEYFEIAKTNKNYAAQVKRAQDDLARVPETRRETERHEIDPARALMLKGLEPAHQFRTLGEVFGKLKPWKKLFLQSRISNLKALWNRHGYKYPLACETFEIAGQRSKFGVILNDDTDTAEGRELEVFTPGNVVEVRDLNGGRLELSEVKDDMRSFKVKLAAGDGMLVEIRFKNDEPGYSLLYDDFTETYRLGRLNEEYGLLALEGKFFRSKNWILKMKDKNQKFDGAMYTIDSIARGGSSYNTASMNMNITEEKGAMWLMMNGYLHGVTVKAVMKGADGEPERKVVYEPRKLNTLPARVPAKTEVLEFNVSHPSSSLFDIAVWYNPF